MVKSIDVLRLMSQGYKSTREIGRALRVSYTLIHRHMKTLEKQGLIRKVNPKRYAVTEEGLAQLEKERLPLDKDLKRFIQEVETLAEVRLSIKEQSKLKALKILGVTYVFNGLWSQLMDIIQKLSDEITPENMKALVDSAYSSMVKELLASIAVYCIGLGREGWNSFHNLAINYITAAQGAGSSLKKIIAGSKGDSALQS